MDNNSTNNADSYSQMLFENQFTTHILPTLKQYEGTRKLKLFMTLPIVFCLLVCIASIPYKFITQSNIFGRYDVEIVIVIGVLCVYALSRIKKRFENEIKEKIMPLVCNCFGNMKWSHGTYNDGEFFSNSFVVPKFKREKYDDIFTGSHKGISIEIIESRFSKIWGTQEDVVFKGIIIKLGINIPSTAHTVILPNYLIRVKPSSTLHYIKLDNSEFSSLFNVFTDNDTDVQSLITPDFKENLQNIKNTFKASEIRCAFFNSHLILALSTRKDVFSIGSLIRPIHSKKQYLKMYKEITAILRIIDLFTTEKV